MFFRRLLLNELLPFALSNQMQAGAAYLHNVKEWSDHNARHELLSAIALSFSAMENQEILDNSAYIFLHHQLSIYLRSSPELPTQKVEDYATSSHLFTDPRH